MMKEDLFYINLSLQNVDKSQPTIRSVMGQVIHDTGYFVRRFCMANAIIIVCSPFDAKVKLTVILIEKIVV